MEHFLFTITCTLFLSLITVIAHYTHSDLTKLKNGSFLCGLIFFLLWVITNYLADHTPTNPEALLWTRATFFMSIIGVAAITIFSHHFPKSSNRFSVRDYFYIFASFTVCTLAFTPHIVTEITLGDPVGIEDFVPGFFYIPTLVIYLILIFDTTFSFVRRTLRTNHIHKKQMLLITTGWSFLLVIGSLTNLIIPIIFGTLYFSQFGPLTSSITALLMAYAILKHHLFDIKIVIQKGTIYGLIFIIIASFYLGLIFILGSLLGDTSRVATYISAGITTIFGILTVPRLDLFLRNITNPLFFKNSYDYESVIEQIYDITQHNINIFQIIQKTIHVFEEHLQLDRLVIISSRESLFYTNTYTDEISEIASDELLEGLSTSQNLVREDITRQNPTQKWLRKNNFQIFMPIFFDETMIGGLCFGMKKSGDPFYQKDLKLMKQSALHLSTAMEKGYLFNQKKHQAEILQQKVKERTSQLHKAQEAQERLMVDIAHTLKTPLTILYGELSTLTENQPKEKMRPIQQAIEGVSKSVSSLLKLSRMEHDTEKPDHHPVNISAIAELLYEHILPLARTNELTITKNIAPDISLQGNYDEIEELIMTLLENAIKYTAPKMDKGAIHFKLETKKSGVTMTISDNGVGISKEDLPHIFDRFYRGTTKEVQKISGTGVGLSLCSAIVKRHNGTISATSTPNKNTTFTVSLPLT